MAIQFDTDPIGAILEYAYLQQRDGADVRRLRGEWVHANIKQPDNPFLDAWGGPQCTLTRNHLSQILELGRTPSATRGVVDRVVRLLESRGLLIRWSGDANPESTYRVIARSG